MEINIKEGRVILKLSVDEANIIAASVDIVRSNTTNRTFIRMADALEFKLSSAVAFISKIGAYKDGN